MRDGIAFDAWAREHQRRIETVLEQLLPDATTTLESAMRYATLGGGKRVRPLLAYAASELVDADPFRVDAAAAAVELIHAYSLVHDDLPCMDDDALRRGKPTCHVVYGVATALLAGDALQALAFAVLAQSGTDAGARCALLAQAAGHAGMAGGQQIDIEATGGQLDIDALTQMHSLKTGALIRAAVRLGASSGRRLAGEEAQALDAYADAAGLAFQVVDDVLDVEGSATTLGKSTGKDAAQSKVTFVTLLGVDEARRHARDCHARALAALAPLGGAATRLGEIAGWIARRTA